MKLSTRYKNAILSILGLLIVFVAWQYLYLGMVEKTEAIEKKTNDVIKQVRVLKEHEPNQAFYLSEIDRMGVEMSNWMSVFASDVMAEDSIKFAYGIDNRNTKDYVFVHTMSFGAPTLLYQTNQNIQVKDIHGQVMKDGTLYPTYYLYRKQSVYGLDCTYKGLKNLLEKVYSDSDKKNIENISLSFNKSTGQLSGNVIVNFYYVAGLDKQYVLPAITPVRQGVDNIFGTVND